MKISNDESLYLDLVIRTILLIFILIYLYRFKNIIFSIDLKIKRLKIEKNVFFFLLFLFLSMIAILTISQIIKITSVITIPLFLIFVIFTSFTAFQLFSFIKSYSYKKEAELKIAQNNQLDEHLKNIEQQYQDLRHFKHDYQNMLLALGSFANKGDQEQFKAYYDELVKNNPLNNDLDNLTIGDLDHLKNEPIKGLIIQKFFTAQKLGIKLKLEIPKVVKIKNQNILSIVRIIGILLDNAIENMMHDHEKEVDCAFIKGNDFVEIVISNHVDTSIDVNRLFNDSYTTKINHQGFGLNNVRKLVSEDDLLFLESGIVKQHLRIVLMITGE